VSDARWLLGTDVSTIDPASLYHTALSPCGFEDDLQQHG
jgi:hypothetical protein